MGFKGKSISVASYDAGNRLTAWNRAGADENNSQTWNYDDAGNWNSTTKDGDTEGRNHSVSNQITQLDGKAVSHDLKGNLTDYEYDRTDYRVKYDLDNRIVEVKADSETIRYRYDALGRRIVSKGDDETVLIWWGDSECAEYEHRASQDAIQNDIMGHPTRLNSVIARDTEDRENRVELQWYHKNYLDHVYAVSDDNGNLIEHYRYTAFGEPEIYSATGARRNTSAIGNTVMWNTRRYDADNGLYYYKYRHYAANIGRWLGRDPIEEDGGVNLYAFVGNDSVGSWDKLGLKGKRGSGRGPRNDSYGDSCGECTVVISAALPKQEGGKPAWKNGVWMAANGIGHAWLKFLDNPENGGEGPPETILYSFGPANNDFRNRARVAMGGHVASTVDYSTTQNKGNRNSYSWSFTDKNICLKIKKLFEAKRNSAPTYTYLQQCASQAIKLLKSIENVSGEDMIFEGFGVSPANYSGKKFDKLANPHAVYRDIPKL